MIGWVLVTLIMVFNVLLFYRMVADHRRWKREQAEWECRIQDSWARFIEAAEREQDNKHS